MEKVRAISLWLKSNPLIALAGILAGALTAVYTLIVSSSNITSVILKAFDRPDCFTYASVYHSPWSQFKLEGAVWREYFGNDNKHRFEFKEFNRTRQDIVLQNLTPRPDFPIPEYLMIRVPVCGGTSKVTTGMPLHWTDWVEFRRE
jgi:hypothetical protein